MGDKIWIKSISEFNEKTAFPLNVEKDDKKSSESNKIPLFFIKQDNILKSKIKRCALQSLISRKNESILSSFELEKMWQLLLSKAIITKDKNIQVIGYNDFCEISKRLPQKLNNFFRPSIFLHFARDEEGRVDIKAIFNFVLRRASLFQERTCLAQYDSDADGFLSENELERYINDLIPSFPQLEGIEEGFKPFYVCGAARKFFFFLDIQRKGKISIKDILLSPILSEFFELQQQSLAQGLILTNWFSLYSSLRVYGEYMDLDVDKNGMLSRDEL
jgi:serine/threonine-protein phosphatase 2A regulatory subunit B''